MWEEKYAEFLQIGNIQLPAACYQPMFDQDYEEALTEIATNPLLSDDDWVPNPDRYRPKWKESERTWLQVYETVSEGTPVTPPFATPQELVEYLATRGDFWDQKRGDRPWPRKQAEEFVARGWAPRLIATANEAHDV